MFMFDPIKQRLLTWRRDRAVDRVVSNSTSLNNVLASRAGIDGEYEHTFVDAAYLDSQADRLRRCIDNDLAFLRRTA